LGSEMLLETGTTTVLDIESFPHLLTKTWPSTPLRMVSFLEMIHIRSDIPADETISKTIAYFSNSNDNLKSTALSPHAPYTTTPALLKKTATYCRNHGIRLAIHVSESEEEFNMFNNRKGPMFDWLAPQRNMDDCVGVTPIEHLERCGILSDNCMAVHVNSASKSDMVKLAEHKVTITHCPGSHVYFNHPPFPYFELKNRNINVCLGTDSLASMQCNGKSLPRLSMFDEMSRFSNLHPNEKPMEIIAMCTLHPALFLQNDFKLGTLEPGACADLIAVPFDGKSRDSAEAVVHHQGNVAFSMINGRTQLNNG